MSFFKKKSTDDLMDEFKSLRAKRKKAEERASINKLISGEKEAISKARGQSIRSRHGGFFDAVKKAGSHIAEAERRNMDYEKKHPRKKKQLIFGI